MAVTISKLALSGLTLSALLVANPVQAVNVFNFSYVSNVGTLAGELTGTLQGDNNTIQVSAINSSTFNAAPGVALPYLNAVSTYFGGPATPPVVSLNGLNMNLVACTSSACPNGFAFVPPGILNLSPVFTSGSSYGQAFEVYSPAKWSVTAVPFEAEALPLLATTALFGLGVWGKHKLSQRRKLIP